MITGILLSVSRIGGETAPLIMTILGSSQFFSSMDVPMDALTFENLEVIFTCLMIMHNYKDGDLLLY